MFLNVFLNKFEYFENVLENIISNICYSAFHPSSGYTNCRQVLHKVVKLGGGGDGVRTSIMKVVRSKIIYH